MLTAEYLAPPPRRRWVSRLALALVLALAATAGYAYFIEPNRLEVTRHRITGSGAAAAAHRPHQRSAHPGLRRPGADPGVPGPASEAPDLIVITGDTVDKGKLAPARDLLANLSAPLGVWIVRGNWERWTLQEDEKAFYAAGGAVPGQRGRAGPRRPVDCRTGRSGLRRARPGQGPGRGAQRTPSSWCCCTRPTTSTRSAGASTWRWPGTPTAARSCCPAWRRSGCPRGQALRARLVLAQRQPAVRQPGHRHLDPTHPTAGPARAGHHRRQPR